MNSTREYDRTHCRPSANQERWKLLGLPALMAVAGLGLRSVGGLPRLPEDLPDAERLVGLLTGSTLPMGLVAVLLVDVAWLLWVWIVGSLCLELLVVAAETVTQGAVWVRRLRRVANYLTLPLARKAVAAAFAVQVLSRGVPMAAAAPLDMSQSVVVAQANPMTDVSAGGVAVQPDSSATYVVKPGDTLWSIAEQAYGSGTAYRRLVDANIGRRMADGQRFSARGVIQPGWELLVPDSGGPAEPRSTADERGWYTVQTHDTLSALAASTLGDQQRWPELFEANRGAISEDGRHTLTDPNLIWPGLRLQLADVPVAADGATIQSDPGEADQTAASTPPYATTPSSSPAPPPAENAPSTGTIDDSNPPIQPVPVAAATETADAAEFDAPPPLLRAARGLEPVVLEPSDVAEAQPDAAASAVPDSEGSLPASSPPIEMPAMAVVLGGLGLVAAGGVAFGVRRTRRLTRMTHEPETEVVVEGGFAEAELAHDLTRGLHGVSFDPVTALVTHLHQFLGEYNLGHVAVVAAQHGRSATTLSLAAGLAEQPMVVDLAGAFASRLDSDVEASVNADQDVVWRLIRLRRTRLLPAATTDAGEQACMLPLGVLYDRQVYAANWRTLGNVLVASLAGHGADTILTSLVATLGARRSPQHLRLWLIAPPRALPAPIFELPHVARSIDPGDEEALRRAMEDLRAELDHRSSTGFDADLVVVVPELTDLGSHAAMLEVLAVQAASVGVRFIAATSCPDAALASPMMSHFGTRMVLRMQDEDASVALLGVADAAFLGGGGRLLLRLDGREPVELYGYQVAVEHLDRLVRVMRAAYPPVVEPPDGPPAPPSQPAPVGPIQPAVAVPPEAAAPTSVLPEPAEAAATGQADDGPRPTQAPPIRVICFGGPQILCGDQQVWPKPAGGEAKPWEFLLYIACQPVEGVSSDEAVEALWPEDDQADDAPHRFRQLRYRLRRLLNGVTGAPETDGVCFDRGKLRLDPAVVYSDAQEFLSLVRSARLSSGSAALQALEQARTLYAGDLLEGPDARRYGWLDERDDSGVTLREHFRKLFQQASLRLAELYAVRGDLDPAVAIYRELTDIDAGDERYWRALFRLHAERGDRLGLVREEHRMRDALRELAADIEGVDSPELEEPSRDMLQEYQRLLETLRDSEREAATA